MPSKLFDEKIQIALFRRRVLQDNVRNLEDARNKFRELSLQDPAVDIRTRAARMDDETPLRAVNEPNLFGRVPHQLERIETLFSENQNSRFWVAITASAEIVFFKVLSLEHCYRTEIPGYRPGRLQLDQRGLP
jgi:hypothetical protein